MALNYLFRIPPIEKGPYVAKKHTRRGAYRNETEENVAWTTMGEQGAKTGPNVELTVLHGAYHDAAYVALRKHAGYNWWVKPLRQRGGSQP